MLNRKPIVSLRPAVVAISLAVLLFSMFLPKWIFKVGAEEGPTKVANRAKFQQSAIQKWIDELNHDDYQVRTRATNSLVKCGRPAIKLMERSAGRSSIETDLRIVRVIQALCWSEDSDTRDEAYLGLVRLAGNDHARMSRLATMAIRVEKQSHQPRLRRKLTNLGAVCHLVASSRYQNDQSLRTRSIELTDQWKGGDAALVYVCQLEGLTSFRSIGAAITDRGLAHLANISKLESIELRGGRITGTGLTHLVKLQHLRTLSLTGVPTSDSAFANLASMKTLRGLELDNTKLGDAGLIHVGKMPDLKWLSLNGTSVTDEGLLHLHGMTRLRRIYLKRCQVTDTGIAQLRKSLPSLTVIR